MNSYIELNRDDGIARLVINRPESRNALTRQMLIDFTARCIEISDDDEIRAVIVASSGDDFSIGADLVELQQAPAITLQAARREAEIGGEMLRVLKELRQPTVAVLSGVATGGGACIATACDFRIACPHARVGYGEVKMGMNLMWHALPLCVQLVGPARAKRLIMTGDLFTAAELTDWGFIDILCENREASIARACALAAQLAALPPLAVQMIKRSINRYAGALDAAIMHADADQWLLTSGSEDFSEAVSAFMAKRPPSFTGN